MIIEWIAGFVAMTALIFAVYHLGIKHGKKEITKSHVEYPGLPDDFDRPPTYDDFARPKIKGVRLPELF